MTDHTRRLVAAAMARTRDRHREPLSGRRIPHRPLPVLTVEVGPAPDWHADALCSQVDLEIFFPAKGESTAAAKRVCAGCPAAAPCLEWALDNNIAHGIWGGLSERQRRAVARQRASQPTEGAA